MTQQREDEVRQWETAKAFVHEAESKGMAVFVESIPCGQLLFRTSPFAAEWRTKSNVQPPRPTLFRQVLGVVVTVLLVLLFLAAIGTIVFWKLTPAHAQEVARVRGAASAHDFREGIGMECPTPGCGRSARFRDSILVAGPAITVLGTGGGRLRPPPRL